MKRHNCLLASLLVLLCLSACQNVTESAEPQEVVQQQLSEEEPTAPEGLPEAEEPTLTEEPIQAEESEQPITEETAQPMNLSDYDLQYGQQEEFIKIYSQIQPVEQAESFEGTWQRTEVANSLSAELTITEQTEEGFMFVGDFYYYSHSGYMEGNANFVAPNVAVYEHVNDWGWEEEEITSEYLVFEKTEEGMKLYASSSSADLGFGMNVFADGVYVQGEPVYTNATVLNDNFTLEEQEKMAILLGMDYEDYFKLPVEMGILTSTPATLADGSNATYYEAFIPTMGGFGFGMLICENGDIYFNSEAAVVGWKTNVEGAIDYPAYTLEENQ